MTSLPEAIVFDLFPIAWHFPAGSRLRLSIACSAPMAEQSTAPIVTVHRSSLRASDLTLPVTQEPIFGKGPMDSPAKGREPKADVSRQPVNKAAGGAAQASRGPVIGGTGRTEERPESREGVMGDDELTDMLPSEEDILFYKEHGWFIPSPWMNCQQPTGVRVTCSPVASTRSR